MQLATSRDFLKVALQRLDAAEHIMAKLLLNLESQYIGGYSLECSLKALILHYTAEMDQMDVLKDLTRGANNHRPEVLLNRLRQHGIMLSIELAKRMRRFDWTTDLRYETGRRDTGETKGLLRTVRAVYEWAEGQMT